MHRNRTNLAGYSRGARRHRAALRTDPCGDRQCPEVDHCAHWREPLQQQTSEPVTRHHAAAAAIGRHGLGLAIRRRRHDPAPDRGRLWAPPARPDHRPSATKRRCRSFGSPPRPLRRRGVAPDNTHRQRPTPFGPQKDLLLLSNQERLGCTSLGHPPGFGALERRKAKAIRSADNHVVRRFEDDLGAHRAEKRSRLARRRPGRYGRWPLVAPDLDPWARW